MEIKANMKEMEMQYSQYDGSELYSGRIEINGQEIEFNQSPESKEIFPNQEIEGIDQEEFDKIVEKEIEKLNTWQRDANSNFTELLPIKALKALKEWDRKKEPKLTQEELETLKQSIKEEGIKEPLILKYNPVSGYALLVEGNNRIEAADKNGEYLVPVRVLTDTKLEEKEGKGAYIKNPRLRIPKNEYCPKDMKPSQIMNPKDIQITKDPGELKRNLFPEITFIKERESEVDGSKLHDGLIRLSGRMLAFSEKEDGTFATQENDLTDLEMDEKDFSEIVKQSIEVRKVEVEIEEEDLEMVL